MKRILSILSWIGLALVVAALVIRVGPTTGSTFIRPEWDKYAPYLAYAGLALVLIYTLGQWREIAEYFRNRQARYGAVAGASVLIVLGILIAVNYLSTQKNKRWDLTANKQYSLSDQTVKLLKSLTAPVKIMVFDKPDQFDTFHGHLDAYAYESPKVTVEYIDADKQPVETKQFDVQTYGTIVIQYMGRTEHVTSNTEQDITNGLIKAINPQTKKVYFLQGHGEKDPASSDRGGYNGIAAALKRDNYEFDKLVLAQTNEIPKDATEIIIAGPKSDILDSEAALLKDYLNKQGKLFVMLDPPDNLKQPTPMPNVTGLLKDWGIDATNSVVVDVSGRTSVATVPVAAPPYPGHPITDNFNLLTMFPLARAITAEKGDTAHPATSFIQTSARSWAETNFAELQDTKSLAPEPDKGDLAGPVSIGAAVTVAAGGTDAKPASNEGADQKKPETRVAAIGDSDFASNAYLGVEGNSDLFMNTVNWLSQQENLISIRARDAADRRITVTANGMTWLFWMSIVLIPAAVFFSGFMTWLRRR
ncbi:MAG TPA: Gldg family protein [Vicinamibacterales bacterium]|nr:Gldg family protein [Vicinamibacterales bacterium]